MDTLAKSIMEHREPQGVEATEASEFLDVLVNVSTLDIFNLYSLSTLYSKEIISFIHNFISKLLNLSQVENIIFYILSVHGFINCYIW